MFTKSPSASRQDKGPSKQSVFPNNGNILKKKARSTILSVLSKRQTQEKQFLGERSEGQQNNSISSLEPALQQAKWPSEAMMVNPPSTKPKPQRSVPVRSQSYQFAPPSQAWTSQQDIIASSRHVETQDIARTGLDVLDGNSNVGKLSSRWPPQPRYPVSDRGSLGWRRTSAPKHLSCPSDMETALQNSDAMVVSMSPSYTSVKDITQETPMSPKFESDSVKVSIPFQVQSQNQKPIQPSQTSDAWSSSVSICVPFQVNENGDSVSLLSHEPSLPADSGHKGKSPIVTGEDEKDGADTKPRAESSPQPGRRKPPKEGQSRNKKVTKDSLKTMGKEASKHKPMDKAVSSTTALKVSPGGKQRSKSFNAGDRVKLAPSPTGTPPNGTPRSSPGNSPKPPRRHAMSKDMIKKRPSDLKKHDAQGRPHSDPIIAEKVHNKKKFPGGSANDPSATGKTTEVETLKSKVKDLEQENNKLKEKIQPMEHRLAVVPLLEKEKLHLQKQFNEIMQENEKLKSELESINLSTKKQNEERLELQAKHDKLTEDLENSQEVVKDLKHKNLLLEEVKSTLERENEVKEVAMERYLANIENLTSSNTALLLQDGRSRNKISILLEGLQSFKACVVKLKEENNGLHLQIIENGNELARTMKNCVSGLGKVLDGLETEKSGKLDQEVQVFIDTEKLEKDTQCGDFQSVELILLQLEESKQSVECLKNRINELESRTVANEEQEENVDSELFATTVETTSDPQRTVQEVNEGDRTGNCTGCKSLQMKMEALSTDLDAVKASLQKSESERDDAIEERNELRREAKYLKYVLSYREDVQSLQANNQQCKELERMGTNLVEAEKKVLDLEDEVGRLQEEKQTLLLSILNLYAGHEVEDVKEEDEEEAEHEVEGETKDVNTDKEDKDNSSEVFAKSPSVGVSPRTPESSARREQLKFRFQLSLSESEYSYSSDRTEGEEESDSEDVNSPTTVNVQAIKTENKQLKSNLFEANEEKEELLSSLDKLCEEYDSLKESHDKLEEEHNLMSDRATKEKVAYQTRLRQVEMERENMRDTLRQVQDEKLALLKCLEMKNSDAQPLSPLSDTELSKIVACAKSLTQEERKSNESTPVQNLEMDKIIAQAQSFTENEDKSDEQTSMSNVELDKIIARAQSFTREESESSKPSSVPNQELDTIIARTQSLTREENKSSEPTSNEEDSDASLSSETEDDEKAYNKHMLQKTPNNEEVSDTQTTPTTPEDRDLAGIVASIENDLSKLKERLYRRDTPGDGSESRPSKPPPGARILKRQASTVKSNLDRVSREKQHLQDEVESLRRYLLKRRDSAMDLTKKRSRGSLKRDTASEVESHLEGIKTLQALLGKSDEQLRQSNEIISRLEAVNDETEEKLREYELLKDDLRRAVQIANNFAMEEQQKAEQLAQRNEDLLKQIEVIKKAGTLLGQKDVNDDSKEMFAPKPKPKLQLKGSKTYNRNISEDDYEDDESNLTTEGESDFYSSRHSSINSESDFVRSPGDYSPRDMNSSVVSLNGEEDIKNQDTETEGTSLHSSTVDTSDTDDDKE